MKRTSIAAIIVAFGMQLNAQDLIVTKKKDSINAKITKLKKGIIYFRHMERDKLKKTQLSLAEVNDYQKSFYETPKIPSNAKVKSGYESKRFRIAANAGFAFRTAKIEGVQDETVKKYIKRLKSGSNWGLNAHYFISERLAFGIKYNAFNSTEAENNLAASFPDGSTEIGLENSILINFVGPSLMTKLLSANKKNALLLSTAVGYMSYKNEETVGQRFLTSTGNTIGVSVDVGYDIGLTDYMSIGCVASWTTGTLRELEVKENGFTTTVDLVETVGVKEGLSRINISGGLRFYL